MRARAVLVLLVLALGVVGLPLESPASHADVDPAPGSILAPVGRQAGWLNLDAPRPHSLTTLPALDGSPPRLLAPLGGDDASVAWSPDGTQIFSYSGTGSAIVDVTTGEVSTYSYLAGYGSTAWLPVQAP